MLFGNFQVINIYFAKCFEKRCREIIESKLNDTQCGLRLGRSTTNHISLSRKIFRNLGSMLKTSSHALSTSRKHTIGFLVKSFVECCVCTVLTAACHCTAVASLYSCSEVCLRVGRVKSRPFTVSVGLRQGCARSPLISIVYISGSQPFRWREPNPDFRFFWRASLKFFTQFNWHVLFYRRTKPVTRNIRRFIERVLRAVQRVPGSQMRPQNRGWEPLVHMNWIDNHSRVDEGVTVGSWRINRLPFQTICYC